MAEQLTAAFLIRKFNEIIGWPYVSPGTNDENGIDCSGAFVRAYRAAGKNIYHGSNRIERVYCRDCFDLHGSASGLKEGMAIFKYREPNEDGYGLPQDYRAGGKYYNGDERDYTHIGLVTSVKPLGITNATSPVARVDTKIGSGIHSWRRAGYLQAVIYNTAETGGSENSMSALVGKTCKVVVESGSTVNLRNKPDGDLVVRIPAGALVLCSADTGTWASIRWDDTSTGKTYAGYMMSRFLTVYADENGEKPGEEDPVGPYCVSIYCDTLEEAETLVRLMKKAGVEAG